MNPDLNCPAIPYSLFPRGWEWEKGPPDLERLGIRPRDFAPDFLYTHKHTTCRPLLLAAPTVVATNSADHTQQHQCLYGLDG